MRRKTSPRKLLSLIKGGAKPRQSRVPTTIQRATTIALVGFEHGSGKTVLSANLALSLHALGNSVLLIDANFERGSVHRVLGIRIQGGSRRQAETPALHELAPRLKVAPAYGRRRGDQNDIARARQVQSLLALEHDAEIILLDTPSEDPHLLGSIASVADQLVVVATPERSGLTHAYALLKKVAARERRPAVSLLLNNVRTFEDLRHATQCLQESASRYLKLRASLLGWIAHDDAMARAVAERVPIVRSAPESVAARAIDKVAARLHHILHPPPPERAIDGEDQVRSAA
jgi:flagellar biosynthesis protein FlhG